MAYATKPSFITKESRLFWLLNESIKGLYFDEVDTAERRDALQPAIRHGYVKMAKTGRITLTSSGRQLMRTAR